MAVGTMVSVEEYLSTVYETECEYVDGEVIERNIGESDHSGLRAALIVLLYSQTRARNPFVSRTSRADQAEALPRTRYHGNHTKDQGTNPSGTTSPLDRNPL